MAGSKKRRKVDLDDEVKVKITHPILVMAVIAVIVIIVVAMIYMIIGSGGISSIVVGNVNKDMDGISFPIYTSKDGFGEFNGEIKIQIFYEEMKGPIYEKMIPTKGGSGDHRVHYDEFVWGNGNYSIVASANGKSDHYPISIHSVADRILVEWKGENFDEDKMEPDYKVEVSMGYQFGTRPSPYHDDPQWYSFLGKMTTPDGRELEMDSDDYPSNLLWISMSTDHTKAGTYSLTGAVTNTFCHPNSPYRHVYIEEDRKFKFDADPFAVLGDDVTISLVDGEATVLLDASGSWDDSHIIKYTWQFDEGWNKTTSLPTLAHTFSKTGTYFISLSLEDDSGNYSDQNGDLSSLTVKVE